MISIIVPIYNAHRSLRKCIESIINQSISDEYEIVLVDNASTDGSKSICNEFINRNSNIKYYYCPTIGVSAARNMGIDNSVGDIVGFCDADDYYEIDTLSRVLYEFKNDDIDLLITGYANVPESGAKRMMHINKVKFVNTDRLRGMLLCDRRILGSVCNKFYKRELIKEVRFNEKLSYCEDLHFNMCLVNKENIRCLIIPQITYNYVYNPISATNNDAELYNEKGELKYIDALNSIVYECTMNKRLLGEISYAKTSLAIDRINGLGKEDKHYSYFNDLIKENISGFFLYGFRYQIPQNIKKIIRLIKWKIETMF